MMKNTNIAVIVLPSRFSIFGKLHKIAMPITANTISPNQMKFSFMMEIPAKTRTIPSNARNWLCKRISFAVSPFFLFFIKLKIPKTIRITPTKNPEAIPKFATKANLAIRSNIFFFFLLFYITITR